MKQFFRFMINTFFSSRLDLRVRLFNMLAMAGVLVSLVFTGFHIVAKSPINVAFCLAGAALAGALLVYATRTKNYQRAYIITVIAVFLILFPTMFFSVGGYKYGMTSFFIFAVAFTVFMLEGKKSLFLAGVELLVYSALCAFAYIYPERINYYTENPDPFWGILICFFSSSVAVGIAIFLHLKLYNEQQRELEAARQKLSEENAMLERVNQLKTEFLGNVSHELKTPLTVMSGYAQTTKQLAERSAELDGGEVKRRMKLISSEAERLSLMVGQILDVTRIEEGRMAMEKHPCHVDEIIHSAVETHYPMLNKNANRLEIHIDPGLPAVSADPARISQVIVNLISNAVRFTANGLITVTAKQEHTDIVVCVADTGSGISRDRLPHLFQRYSHNEKNGAGQNTGTGLGLYICKHIVEQHGGTIRIESELEAGTSVFFILPIL